MLVKIVLGATIGVVAAAAVDRFAPTIGDRVFYVLADLASDRESPTPLMIKLGGNASMRTVTLQGDYEGGCSEQLRAKLLEGDHGERTVVIDLKAVRFSDSLALNALVQVRDELEGRGVVVYVTNPSLVVARLFGVTRPDAKRRLRR